MRDHDGFVATLGSTLNSCVYTAPLIRVTIGLRQLAIEGLETIPPRAMSRPLRIEYSGALYHVTARGNESKEIFRDDADRIGYLERLARYRARFGFRVHAYCLMTNHVHLAIETLESPLSRIMLTFHGAYSQAFNRRHDRFGHLFQGRYKAFLVQKDRYLLALLRYIHENPVKAGIVRRPQDYRWSSDRAYRTSNRPAWLDVDLALSLLANRRAGAINTYRAFMARSDPGTYECLSTVDHIIRGDEAFAVRVAHEAGGSEVTVRTLTPARVHRSASRVLHIDEQNGCPASRLRGIVGYVGRERGRIPLSRTAEYFRKHDSTLVRDVRRLEDEMSRDDSLRELVRGVSADLFSAAIQR